MAGHCANCGKYRQRNVRDFPIADPLVFDYVKNHQVEEHSINNRAAQPDQLSLISRICKACRNKYERYRRETMMQNQGMLLSAGPSCSSAGPSFVAAGLSQPAEQRRQDVDREEEEGYSDETEIMSGFGSLSVSEIEEDSSSDEEIEYREDEEESGDEDFDSILIEAESVHTMVSLCSTSMCIFRRRRAQPYESFKINSS